jgi:uncharacterized membrane-anchored protein YhcB (DUF1043 family)
VTSEEHRQLVAFLGQQFARVDQQFARVDQRFAGIDTRLDELTQTIRSQRAEFLSHFDTFYARLDRLEQEYQMILQALRRIEGRLGDSEVKREILERSVEELKGQVAALLSRIEAVEGRVRG